MNIVISSVCMPDDQRLQSSVVIFNLNCESYSFFLCECYEAHWSWSFHFSGSLALMLAFILGKIQVFVYLLNDLLPIQDLIKSDRSLIIPVNL